MLNKDESQREVKNIENSRSGRETKNKEKNELK